MTNYAKLRPFNYREDNMTRYCPCGNPVGTRYSLCRECANIYGYVPAAWPEWLRWMVNDINRVSIQERRHVHLSIDDEIEPNGRAGYRPKSEFVLRGCRTETHLYEDREKY